MLRPNPNSLIPSSKGVNGASGQTNVRTDSLNTPRIENFRHDPGPLVHSYSNYIYGYNLVVLSGHSPETNDSITQFLLSEGAVGEVDAILDQVRSSCQALF